MEKITITLNNNKIVVNKNTTLLNIIKITNDRTNPIGALINNEICELSFPVRENSTIEFFPYYSPNGLEMYKRALKFIYIEAIKNTLNTSVRLLHSIDKGLYTQINTNKSLSTKTLFKIKEEMKRIIKENYPIIKTSANRKSVIKYFIENKDIEKATLYKQQQTDTVTIYELNNSYNYFYGPMPTSTGIIKYFDLELVGNKEIVLQFPYNQTNIIPKYTPKILSLGVYKEYNKTIASLGVQYISDLNNIILHSKINEFIKINEILHNDKLSIIASNIYKIKSNIKLVLIGGPSSSGKTTTSKKLALYLKSKGLNPFIISTDDYFLNRDETKIDEDGKRNYEAIDSIDLKLFNKHLKALLNNKEVTIPTYNFLTGEKEYKNKPVNLKERDLIIIEGLHTMNEELTKSIPRNKKYKIYASPFTPLAIDKHNHISSVDIRLIRRLVRDNSHRGYSADQTLTQWPKVREGENKYVFPYQEDADIIYNTAIIYELGVLKTYAQPLLSSIEEDNINYETAKRLLNFLKLFLPVPETFIPDTSLLKEFVGTSYFK
ncbi:MAG: nucleoside kinase [Bacilli bacterium]